MGNKAQEVRQRTERKIRSVPLSDAERERLQGAVYEGSPVHKRNPGDFGLTPPAAPRQDKTLCDEAGVFRRSVADDLFRKGIERGLVSHSSIRGYPKQFWVVGDDGQVFEAIYGGSREGSYHGYPIRRSDPFFEEVTEAWGQQP